MTREEAITKEECLAFYKELTNLADARFVPYYEMAIEALEKQSCEDCINREKAKQFLYERHDRLNNDELYDIFSRIIDDIYNELPSVIPQPKTGHWIINEDEENAVHGHCSVCGWEAHYYEDDIIGMPYCPNCGAKMESEENNDLR